MFIWYFVPFNDYDHYVTPLIDGSNNDPRYVYNIEHWFGDRRYGQRFEPENYRVLGLDVGGKPKPKPKPEKSKKSDIQTQTQTRKIQKIQYPNPNPPKKFIFFWILIF